MSWPFGCSKQRHRSARVVALGAELRGDPERNNVRAYVRFYVECQRCGATGTRLREVGKVFHTPNSLIVDDMIWDHEP